MLKISLLGCGWLGLPLAKKLIENGCFVNGSTTSTAKISTIEKTGIHPFLISLEENKIEGDIASFLKNSEVLIIAIPPKLRSSSSENFVAKIQTLISYIEKSSIKKVLFVSSTAVYDDDNSIVTEATNCNPKTESGKQLVAIEKLLQNNTNFKTTSIRFGGLIGDDRHPIKFLSGRKNIENPDAPINLIHQNDCIGIITKIIEKEIWNETFNAVAPEHPNRKEYYTKKAIELNLALPEFDTNTTSTGKTIVSEKLETILEYKFQNKI
jgi:nucleoside-diphosphate-sugar epimerase